MTLGSLLDAAGATPDDVARHLSAPAQAEVHSECLALTAGQQKKLWLLTSPAGGTSTGELLTAPTVVFAGRNSLRFFSRFEKWFAREDGATVGCNRHALAPLIGPGYFTVRDDGSPVLEFDYNMVPSQAPRTWPRVKSNDALLARPVYANLHDRVVWVSPDVLVGAAYRGGEPLDSYFVLVRALR